jgi:PAS domain S-box-containing protein
MESETRYSGIEVIGSVPWGTHFCQFYRTKQDLISILVPYFRAGLESNEFCLWVTSEPLTVAEAQEAMREAVPGFDQHLSQGGIEILPYREWYLAGGTFNEDRVLKGWLSKLEQALARGYAGLRLSGNAFWLGRNHWRAFTEYEAKVNAVIGKYRMLAICSYCLDKCDGAAVIDVVKNHQFALVKQDDKWDIIESAIYKQAQSKLAQANQQLEDLARFPQENPNPVLRVDRDGSILFANTVCSQLPSFKCRPGQLLPSRYREIAAEVLDSGSSRVIEAAGKDRVFMMNFVPVTSAGYVNIYGNDITERKQAEEALRKSEEKFRIVSEFAYDWEYWRNPDERFLYVSPSCLRFTGYTTAEFVSDPKLYLSIIHPDDRQRVRAHMKEDMHHREGVKLEFRIIRRDGQERWISHACQPALDAEGNLLGRRASNRDITERKEAEAELQKAHQDLNRAQAVAQTGSWRLDVQRNELLWSDETHRIFGIPRGKPMTYETFLSCVHPEDREYVDSRWQAALQGEEYDAEHRIIVGDEIRWVRDRAELEFDEEGMLKGGFGTAQDVTERRKMEENLRQTRDYLDNLFAHANAPIIVWDPELKITRFNHAFERLTGRSAHEVLGKKVDILIPADKLDEALKKIDSTTREGERWEVVEVPIRHVNGSVRTVLWNSATIFDTDGKTPLATIAQGQDITELKKVEQLKDEFIGLVSHELRTPLTVVNGAIRTAMDDRIPQEERRQLLEDAVWGSESLTAILNNLLELSRYQADRLKLNKKAVSIREIAGKAVLAAASQHPRHPVSLAIPDKFPRVIVDPVRLESTLYNLIDNACKFSPEGSEVEVFARQEKKAVVIGISDHGPGIPPEEQEGLFEPFSRLGGAQTKGTGLGLVVCKRLVEAHGGRIWVESKPGEGTTFLFTIPLGKSPRA